MAAVCCWVLSCFSWVSKADLVLRAALGARVLQHAGARAHEVEFDGVRALPGLGASRMRAWMSAMRSPVSGWLDSQAGASPYRRVVPCRRLKKATMPEVS
jgi:hypothetical protein